MNRRIVVALIVTLSTGVGSCGGGSAATPTGPTSSAPSGLTLSSGVRDDAAMFRLVTQTDPFSRYTAFPNAEEFTTGRLNGSEAHRPVIRVSLNSTAAGALQGGRLPANGAWARATNGLGNETQRCRRPLLPQPTVRPVGMAGNMSGPFPFGPKIPHSAPSDNTTSTCAWLELRVDSLYKESCNS